MAHPPVVGFRLASDAHLARLAATGSAGAMTAIFERHHEALHRYCWSIVGNGHDAADALQNTMIKALRALPGEAREIALRPWLYRIAHNESISLLRARRPDSELDAASHLSDLAGADAVQSRERMRALSRDLSELTERQRSALLMRELGGLAFSEVASALDTSPAAAKQSVYEARCALQSLEEGRAMDCDAIRRTISDGDRRALKGLRVRGHLRACAGCRDFELAMRTRPQQLTAIIPPLPAAAAAAILQSVLGGGGAAGGGGMLAWLAGPAKVTGGLSATAKLGATVAVTAALGGGAAVAVPLLEGGADRPAPASAAGPAAPAASQARRSAITPAGRLRLAGGSNTVAATLTPTRAPAPSSASGASAGPGSATATPGAGGSTTAHGAPAAKGHGNGASSGQAGTAHTGSGKGVAHANGQSAASAHGKPATTGSGRPATLPATASPVATTRRPAAPAGKATVQAKRPAAGSPGGAPETVTVPSAAAGAGASGNGGAPRAGVTRP